MKTLLSFLLGLHMIQPAPIDEIIANEQLWLLPSPLILPDYLPPGFRLVDTRLNQQPVAGRGAQFTYSLVYQSDKTSFMLQTQLSNYQPLPTCQQQLKMQSRPLHFQSAAWPQQIMLYSPACDLGGNGIQEEAISTEQAQKIWQKLSWYRRQQQKFIYLRSLAEDS